MKSLLCLVSILLTLSSPAFAGAKKSVPKHPKWMDPPLDATRGNTPGPSKWSPDDLNTLPKTFQQKSSNVTFGHDPSFGNLRKYDYKLNRDQPAW